MRVLLTNILISASLALLLAFIGALVLTSSYRSNLLFHEAIKAVAAHSAGQMSVEANQGESGTKNTEIITFTKDGEGRFDASAYAHHHMAWDPMSFQTHFVRDTLHLLVAAAPSPAMVIVPHDGIAQNDASPNNTSNNTPNNTQSDEASNGILIKVTQSHLKDTLQTFFAIRFAVIFTVFIIVGVVIARILRFLLIRPLDDLVSSINRFGADPTIAWAIPDSLHARPEFGDVAIALDSLQRNTLLALRQRERLADIGEAVAKINHDIRNALSSAALVTDTLLVSDDPNIQRTAPHFVRSLEQAVELCQSMLDYLVEPPTPNPELTNVTLLAEDLAARLDLNITITGQRDIYIDKAMISRILTNLIRNAAVAGARNIHIDVWQAGHLGVIDVADDGPGIPQGSWNDMFLAFRTNSRGGTGLGLAISRDLAVILGGNLKLARSNENGSEFRLQLPKQIFEI